MAAYAALVSLMHIIEQIQHHPRPPISLDKIQLESLIKNVTFLQDFLEGYSHGGSKEADVLESRIAHAAYAAEDIIESHIVDQILGGSTSHVENTSSIEFYQGLQKVMEDMEFIKKEATEIKENVGIHDQLQRNSTSAGSVRSPSTGQNTMVGFDDILNEIMDKLTGQESKRQIIPIIGMGGIGVFPEDSEFHVSSLTKLWVGEGFLKPVGGKSLEMIAQDYLKDLIGRNLILVHKLGSNGKIKFCKIHDLLRDLCLREAQKEKFVCVVRPHSLTIPQGINTQRRIGIHQSTLKEEYLPQVINALQSASLTRSLICDSPEVLPSLNFRLLRVLKAVDRPLYYGDMHSLEAIFQLVNWRYLAIRLDWIRISSYLSSVYLLWNLQTLIVQGTVNAIAPSEIWKMPQLRHVEFDLLDLPDPASGQMEGRDDDFVLGNLQTLLQIRNFKCGEEVIKRIPNIKKLRIYYQEFEGGSCYCLNNLGRLHKLESLGCFFVSEKKPSRSDLLHNLTFPHSLEKLSLEGSLLHWEDMTTKIGSLPLLQVLKLKKWSFEGPEWETVEGQFCSLKFLLIEECDDLEYWTTESSHFPPLEHLVLRDLDKLKEIPSGIGDIPTLQSIVLDSCSDSAVISAKEILEEQEELGNEGLQVRVHFWEENQLESLASPNFQVEIW